MRIGDGTAMDVFLRHPRPSSPTAGVQLNRAFVDGSYHVRHKNLTGRLTTKMFDQIVNRRFSAALTSKWKREKRGSGDPAPLFSALRPGRRLLCLAPDFQVFYFTVVNRTRRVTVTVNDPMLCSIRSHPRWR